MDEKLCRIFRTTPIPKKYRQFRRWEITDPESPTTFREALIFIEHELLPETRSKYPTYKIEVVDLDGNTLWFDRRVTRSPLGRIVA